MKIHGMGVCMVGGYGPREMKVILACLMRSSQRLKDVRNNNIPYHVKHFVNDR